jgi:hypothetical protein
VRRAQAAIANHVVWRVVLLQRALRLNKSSQKIWIELFRLELLYVAKVRQRSAVLGTDPLLDDVEQDDGNTDEPNGDAALEDTASTKKRARGLYDSDSDASDDDDDDDEESDKISAPVTATKRKRQSNVRMCACICVCEMLCLSDVASLVMRNAVAGEEC